MPKSHSRNHELSMCGTTFAGVARPRSVGGRGGQGLDHGRAS